MKFTLSWLKDHLETSASLEEISTTLTAIGLEVEKLENPGENLRDFVVGEILDAEPHPDADKLQYCRVSDGNQILNIVCGAPNARKGLKTVLAREGVHIPAHNFTIKKTKIRGLESCGMLCSQTELRLGDDSNGIMELPADAPVGAPIVSVLGLDDPVIEIAITPNRGDCLGVRGIARDLAAAGVGILKPLVIEPEQGEFAPKISVTIETPELCPQYIGCEIRGVKNGASPEWLQRRLKAIGLRPISALVDITNYITYHLGRPLHVYDIAKLDGGIVVRHAREGETLAALNDKSYTLTPDILTIADRSKVLGVAGIIGGEESGCSDDTTDVFLEVALFDPVAVAQAGRALQIHSDARYRFERNVDPAGVASGAELGIRMITAICGGKVSEWIAAGHQPKWQRHITFRPGRVRSLGGVQVSETEIDRIFHHLGIEITDKNNGVWNAVPPSWRADIEGEADLVEEVLRIHGYHRIPVTPLPSLEQKPTLSFSGKSATMARRTLASRGFLEARTWAFMQESTARHFAAHNPALMVANPISEELNYMRPSLLPNLIEAAKRNLARGFDDLQLFEVGTQFENVTPAGQETVSAAIRTGHTAPKHVHNEKRLHDVFDAKADALAILSACSMDISKVQVKPEAPSYYHPGRSGTLCLGPKVVLAYFGDLHPLVLQDMDYKGNVVGCEVFMDAIPAPKNKSGNAKPMLQASDYQAVERDFAFLANDNVLAGDIIRAIRNSDPQLVREVRIFDVYKGKGVEPGKQSIAISVTLQATDRTLTDADIDKASKAIIEQAGKQFGGVLRQ